MRATDHRHPLHRSTTAWLATTAIGVRYRSPTPIVESWVDRICGTRSPSQAFVVEVMGRHSGYLAMASAIRCGRGCGAVPRAGRQRRGHRRHGLQRIRGAFDSEGRKAPYHPRLKGDIPGTRLVRRVEETLGPPAARWRRNCRATVPGTPGSRRSASFQDRMVAARLGRAAVAATRRARSDGRLAKSHPSGLPTEDPSVVAIHSGQVLAETKVLSRWNPAP